MGWWKGDDKSHSNSKHLAAGLEATGLYWRMMSWSAAHENDGRIPPQVIPTLAPGVTTSRLKKILSALCSVAPGEENPLIHRTFDDGYEIHDYLDYNPSHEDQERKRAVERDRIASKRHSTPSGVDTNTESTTERVDDVLNDPGPTRPKKLEKPPNPTAGGEPTSPKINPRAGATNPRAVAAALRKSPARLEEQARAYGRNRRGVHTNPEEALEDFRLKYHPQTHLIEAAMDGWSCPIEVSA
jgi:hypothetical protein